MTPEETMLHEQLEDSKAENVRLNGKVAQLESALAQWEQGDTLPPSKQDEETGDNSLSKMVAQLSMRVDNLESRESARAGALQVIDEKVRVIDGKLDIVIRRFEEYPAVDPADIRWIKETLQRMPCLKGCDPDPDARPALHSVRCAGE